jgi:hypothetical protein
MKGRFPDVNLAAHFLGLVPRNSRRLCVHCDELDGECRVLLPRRRRRDLVKRLCAPCARQVLGYDPLAVTDSQDELVLCEYIAVCLLDRLPDRRTVAYRA